MKAKTKPFELRLHISRKALAELKQLQYLTGAVDLTQLIVSSIKLFKFIKEEQAKGSEIIIHTHGRTDRIIVGVN